MNGQAKYWEIFGLSAGVHELWLWPRASYVQTMLPCADQAMLWHRGNETSMWQDLTLRQSSLLLSLLLLLLLLFLLYAWGSLCRVVFFKKVSSLDSWISLKWPCDFSDYWKGIISRWHSVQQQMSVLGNAPTQLQAVYVVYDSGGKVLCGVARVVSREGVPGTNVWRF